MVKRTLLIATLVAGVIGIYTATSGMEPGDRERILAEARELQAEAEGLAAGNEEARAKAQELLKRAAQLTRVAEAAAREVQERARRRWPDLPPEEALMDPLTGERADAKRLAELEALGVTPRLPEARERDPHREYRVRPGDTLGKIAAEAKKRFEEVRLAAEALEHLYRITEGREPPDRKQSGHPDPRIIDRQISALKVEIEELHKRGRHEEAERLERKQDELHRALYEACRRSGPLRQFQTRKEIKDRIHLLENSGFGELRERGRHEEAERLERHLRNLERDLDEARRRQGPPLEPEVEEMERRLHHMHQAAENLHAAGLHEQADELMEQAKELERELQARTAPPPGELEGRIDELTEMVHDLRAEVRELRETVHQLRERIQELSGDR